MKSIRITLLVLLATVCMLAAAPAQAACATPGTVYVTNFQAASAGAMITGLGRSGCTATVSNITATLANNSTSASIQVVGVFTGTCTSGAPQFEFSLAVPTGAGQHDHFQAVQGHTVVVGGGATFCVGFTTSQAGLASSVSATVVYN